MNPLQAIERTARIAAGIEAVAGIALLALFVWSIVWTVQVVRRWERRHEAEVKALQRIAGALSKENAPPNRLDAMWSDKR